MPHAAGMSAARGKWLELTFKIREMIINVRWSTTRKILIHMTKQQHIQRKGRLVQILRQSLFFQSYCNPFLCMLPWWYCVVVWYIFYLFGHLYETVIFKVCKIEFYMFVSETWFLKIRKEYILRAFNNSARRKFNSNREEVMQSWTELHISQFHFFTQWRLCSSERG